MELQWLEELEGVKTDMKLMVLRAVQEGKEQAQTIYEYIKQLGVPAALSTVYSSLKELEREGLIKGEGTRNKRYSLTEKGRKYLEEHKEEVERLEHKAKKFKILKALGFPNLLDALSDLMKIVEELSPEERAEIAVAIGNAAVTVKKIVAKKLTL